MSEPLYPRHANSGPAPEVTPPGQRVLVASFLDGEKIPDSERWMWLVETTPRQSFTFTMPEKP